MCDATQSDWFWWLHPIIWNFANYLIFYEFYMELKQMIERRIKFGDQIELYGDRFC